VTDLAENHRNRRTGKVCLAASRAACVLAFGAVLGLSAAVAQPLAGKANQNGLYSDANGDPTYNIDKDGKTDWATYSGFRRYHSECHVCHGPDGMGSSYAPPLKDSLKTMSYGDFLATVAQGRKNLENGQEKVMPELGLNKNVMCYIDDIYTYLKARSDGALDRGRPPGHEDKPKAWQDAQDRCMGAPS
jgi:methanol metabolism-related c-type cytochrome